MNGHTVGFHPQARSNVRYIGTGNVRYVGVYIYLLLFQLTLSKKESGLRMTSSVINFVNKFIVTFRTTESEGATLLWRKGRLEERFLSKIYRDLIDLVNLCQSCCGYHELALEFEIN